MRAGRYRYYSGGDKRHGADLPYAHGPAEPYAVPVDQDARTFTLRRLRSARLYVCAKIKYRMWNNASLYY